MDPEKERHIRFLIVAHTFPPAPGIGGRRWAKFAKYLAKEGHSVEVLTAESNSKSESSWSADVEGIPVHTYSHYYPNALEIKPEGLAEKTAYRLALLQMKRRSNGTPYDRALCDEKAYSKELLQLLDFQNYDCVLVTGAPFRLLSYTAQLIPRFPELTFVADFRDPWTWGEAYGYKNLSLDRLRFEKDAEQKAVEEFDLISSPWPEIVGKLQRKYAKNAEKIFELPHGYDPDDIPVIDSETTNKSESVKLIYGGSLYADSKDAIDRLIHFVSDNADKYQLDIYSREPFKSDVRSSGVQFHDPLPAKEFFALAKAADYLIFFIPEHAKNGVPSKLYELAALQKPILALGRQGSLSDFIEQNNVGRLARENESLESIFETGITRDSDQKWLEDYSIEAISRRFVNRIKKIIE